MIVQTWEQRLQVVQVLEESPGQQVSLCRDTETGRTSVVTRFTDPALIPQLLPLLKSAEQNPAFSDFQRVFTHQGHICAQLAYSEAPTLEKRLANSPQNLQERLEVAGNLLRQLVLMDMPTVMAAAMVTAEHILVENTLHATFDYRFTGEMLTQTVSFAEITNQVRQVFGLLFQKELEEKSILILTEYLECIQGFQNYLELYTGFHPVQQTLMEQVQAGEMIPKTWLFRAWEKTKKAFALAKPFLVGLVLISAFCYLIYTLITPTAFTGTVHFIEEIGTVSVELIDPSQP
ncbi:MAG: hypothetical protein R3Y62_01640 [Eubacteriales bacterium]